jgi:ATP-dependent RNA helicase RhlE
LPEVPEDYVHRIGRTGRAGSSGAAVSLVDREESRLLADIERLLKRTIPRAVSESFEPPPLAQRTSLDDERPPRPQQARRGRPQQPSGGRAFGPRPVQQGDTQRSAASVPSGAGRGTGRGNGTGAANTAGTGANRNSGNRNGSGAGTGARGAQGPMPRSATRRAA